MFRCFAMGFFCPMSILFPPTNLLQYSSTNSLTTGGLSFFYLKQLRIAQCRLIALAEDTADLFKLIYINQITDKTDIEQRSMRNYAPLIAVTFYQSILTVGSVLCRIMA
jgi:hypothetical protein